MSSAAKGRYIRCGHCGGRVHFRPLQVWDRRHSFNGADAQIRLLHCDRDGAIVEQVGREGIEPRWGIRYTDILSGYTLSETPAEPSSTPSRGQSDA